MKPFGLACIRQIGLYLTLEPRSVKQQRGLIQ